MASAGRFSESLAAHAIFVLGVAALAFALPAKATALIDSRTGLAIGIVGAWRYSWGVLHYLRSIVYRAWVYPRMRAHAYAAGIVERPSYFLVTSFRIPAEVSERVYTAAFEAALAAPGPATVVASIVDLSDQRLVQRVFRETVGGETKVALIVDRIPGTGKRDALAHGFRTIAHLLPPPEAMVSVIDGDSIVPRDLVARCAPFFHDPRVGALTTDERAEVRGSELFRQWYSLRFAQRHILMSSMGLSRRVLTLTGRMSMFRADIVCDPDFVAMVESDFLDHPRFGRFRFLTGDDKSSWFFVLGRGYHMLYVPDVSVATVEDPPSEAFLQSAAMLMVRWYGNMLRTNERALRLGPRRVGAFVWWAILDQRLSMWTCLFGLTTATLATLFVSPFAILVYLVWILASRYAQTLLLLSARPTVSVAYPFLLYFNQIYGSLMKTYVFFRLNRQKWTRQKTTLASAFSRRSQRFLDLESHLYHAAAGGALVVVCSWLLGLTSLAAL